MCRDNTHTYLYNWACIGKSGGQIIVLICSAQSDIWNLKNKKKQRLLLSSSSPLLLTLPLPHSHILTWLPYLANHYTGPHYLLYISPFICLTFWPPSHGGQGATWHTSVLWLCLVRASCTFDWKAHPIEIAEQPSLGSSPSFSFLFILINYTDIKTSFTFQKKNVSILNPQKKM